MTEPRHHVASAAVAFLAGFRRQVVLVFFFTVIVACLYRPFRQAERGDSAIYDYISQTILRGGLPYRDVIEIKAPLSIYMGAGAMALGRVVGLDDVLSVRILEVLLLGALSVVTWLVGREYLRSGPAAMIAFLTPLLMGRFFGMVYGGMQPKLPLMVFGMLSLWFIARDRPFWSGVCGMLACLCWQPGLLFAGVGFLIFTRYLTSWRDLRWLMHLAGAALPLGLLVGYFYHRGALGDLWQWTIAFNYSVFAGHEARTLGASAVHLWNVLLRIFGWQAALVGLSVIGWFVYAIGRLRQRIKQRKEPSADLWRDAILIPPLIYFLFSLLDFQGGPDFIPYAPFWGIFFGFLVVWVSGLEPVKARMAKLVEWARLDIAGPDVAPYLIALLIALAALGEGVIYRDYGWSIAGQRGQIDRIAVLLGPDGILYAHGATEVLVLLDRPNANPYVAFDSGTDSYLAGKRAGGFQSIIDEIEAQKPRVVFLSRLQNVDHARELRQWVREHYKPVEGFDYDAAYVRNEARDNLTPKAPSAGQ